MTRRSRAFVSRAAPIADETMAARISQLMVTEGGIVVGTPAYMSPEQARGEPASAASDIYAFGLLLQELFTGRPPHPKDIDFVTLVARAARAETLPPAGVRPCRVDYAAEVPGSCGSAHGYRGGRTAALDTRQTAAAPEECGCRRTRPHGEPRGREIHHRPGTRANRRGGGP